MPAALHGENEQGGENGNTNERRRCGAEDAGEERHDAVWTDDGEWQRSTAAECSVSRDIMAPPHVAVPVSSHLSAQFVFLPSLPDGGVG
jgi:hypothetical protein